MGLAKIQRLVGDVQLDGAIRPPDEQVAHERDEAFCLLPTEFVEHGDPLLEVDGTAIIGINEAEIPELGALVEVGHAWQGDLEQYLRERIPHACVHDAALEAQEIGEEWILSMRREDRPHEVPD